MVKHAVERYSAAEPAAMNFQRLRFFERSCSAIHLNGDRDLSNPYVELPSFRSLQQEETLAFVAMFAFEFQACWALLFLNSPKCLFLFHIEVRKNHSEDHT